MSKKVSEQELYDLIHGDEGKYGPWFPNRDKLPSVDKHIFSDLRTINTSVDEYIVSNMMNTDYIGWTVKVLLGIELYPFQTMILQTLWKTTFPMLIACRGGSKSWTLAVYAVLRALLDPGCKIVIVGFGLRQAKLVFGYIETMWHNSSILQNICKDSCVNKNKLGPRQNVDLCVFQIGESTIHALPLGDGSRIRGFRANVVIADEFAVIPPDTFDIVVRGFAATAKTPVEETRRRYVQKQLEKLGIPMEVTDELASQKVQGNQIIYSGTAYYAFNHFAKKFEMWRDIINSNNDRDELARIFGGVTNIPEGFNTKDYAIIRLPYNHLPEGFLDDKQLANAKAVLPKNIYLMEYGACSTGNLIVETLEGAKKIVDVNIGDRVLTHEQKYKGVVSKKFRQYNGLMAKFRCGLGHPIEVTLDHLIYTNNGFKSIENLHPRDKIKIFGRTLRDEWIFDLHEYCNKFLTQKIEKREYLYAQPGSYKNGKYKTCKKKKGSIPRYIKFDYNLGLIIGFYAGDGDINKKFTQTNITFNKKQKKYVLKFVSAVKEVFGLNCTVTQRSYENVIRVHIKNKMVCQFLDILVGRGAINKRIRFIKNLTYESACGLITGYWYADGYVKRGNYHASSISISLIIDIKQVLLSLGCYSYTTYRPPKKTYFAKQDRYFNGSESWLLKIKGGYQNIFEDILDNKYNKGPHEFLLNITDYSEYMYCGYVYNLEVEDDHSYMGGGCLHHNCFVKDSDGFFPRSLLEQCICYPDKTINTADGEVCFTPQMRGEERCTYVMGIDPAAERDNFAIVIVEVRPNHSRIIYCWVVNKKTFEIRRKNGWIDHKNYYDYCCHKIRYLAKLFKPQRIEMDSQGGGYAVAEMLRNISLVNLDIGEQPIYETIDVDEPKHTDGETDGPHILHLVKQSSDFNAQANVCLHKSFETKKLLFPAFDVVQMEASRAAEASNKIEHDTFEENINNIEELKNELCTIRMSETSTGKEKFDTPNISQPGSVEGRQIKGRLKKDRYTALLLSHKYIYENEVKTETSVDYTDVVGNIRALRKVKPTDKMYRGPGIDVIPGRGPSHRFYRGTQNGESF